ncbi:MAG TPA: hypothetical protein VFH00_11955 [Candidatus Nitrosotalea sp.]|nr:hypothetical protein [Candidatus Nitrosotalea sp.]
MKRWHVVTAVVIVVVLLLAGIGWAAWWLNDNIDAPGPGATGSGPCSSADSINIQMVFTDGHTVQACTRDRPPCPNQTTSGIINGVTITTRFGLGNQLRSSSRRYIFSIRFDSTLPADAGEQTLTLAPGPWIMPGAPAPTALTSAYISIIPRDPHEEAYLMESGSLTVSSSHGVAHGRIVGTFSGHGPTRPDRPAPSPANEPPVSISGTFACNH